MTSATDRTALYRLYDLGNNLLYVGISNKPLTRWALHASDKPWWSDVAVRDVEWFPTRTQAEQEEVKAISVERPRWNRSAGLTVKHSAKPTSRDWKPAGEFLSLLRRYRRAEAGLSKAQGEVELAIIEEMRSGVSAGSIAKHVPWSASSLQQLGKRGGIPKLREPTVVGKKAMQDAVAEALAAQAPTAEAPHPTRTAPFTPPPGPRQRSLRPAPDPNAIELTEAQTRRMVATAKAAADDDQRKRLDREASTARSLGRDPDLAIIEAAYEMGLLTDANIPPVEGA